MYETTMASCTTSLKYAFFAAIVSSPCADYVKVTGAEISRCDHSCSETYSAWSLLNVSSACPVMLKTHESKSDHVAKWEVVLSDSKNTVKLKFIYKKSDFAWWGCYFQILFTFPIFLIYLSRILENHELIVYSLTC